MELIRNFIEWYNTGYNAFVLILSVIEAFTVVYVTYYTYSIKPCNKKRLEEKYKNDR